MPTKKTNTSTASSKPAVKKVAKKASQAAAKKTSTKSKTAAAAPLLPLVYADNERSFWVSDGQVLNSLVALRDALATMEARVYAAHVNESRNDFAAWVDMVLCDEACAKALRKAKTPAAAKTVVVRHLKVYTF